MEIVGDRRSQAKILLHKEAGKRGKRDPGKNEKIGKAEQRKRKPAGRKAGAAVKRAKQD